MVERVQSQVGQDEQPSAELDGLPPVPQGSLGEVNAEALRKALAELHGSPADLELAGQLNALLPRLARGEAEGRLLLEVLADGSLSGLGDRAGLNCRQEAVRALLRLGFPWALEIDPETLQWFREAEAPRGVSSRWTALAIGLLIAAGGALGYFAWETNQPQPQPPIVAPTPAPLPREVSQVRDLFEACAGASNEPVDTPGRVLISPEGLASPIVGYAPPSVDACMRRALSTLRFVPARTSSELTIPLRLNKAKGLEYQGQ